MRQALHTGGRVLVVLLLVAAGLGTLGGVASAASTWAEQEESFATKANLVRASHGLPALRVDVQLTRVARSWSQAMASADQLSHNPNLGTDVQGEWTSLGENVGYTTTGGGTLEDLVQRLHDAFMNSPGHRQNILGDYNFIGTGVTVTSGGKLWVTVNFMKAPVTASESTGQIDEAVGVSRSVFAQAGSAGGTAAYAVVGRAEMFADSLAGAALAGREGPVLFTPGPSSVDPDPVLHPRTRAEIDRVLGGSGTVYLLGGRLAVSDRVASELQADGYEVRRLAGATRVETSVAVAYEVLARRGSNGEVLIARADNWADAVTGGAYAAYSGTPLVLTPTNDLHPAIVDYLNQQRPQRRWALGGSVALSDGVVSRAGATRVYGKDRSATAVAIAKELWGRTHASNGDRYVSAPAFHANGWAYALAYAPWSAAYRGPQLLVGDSVPDSVDAYLRGLGYGGGISGDMSAASIVPPSVVEQLRRLVVEQLRRLVGD